jgi:uncharacterized protein
MSNELTKIPAGHGRAVRVEIGQKVKLINTYGKQAVDYWAINAYDLYEFMDVGCCRVHSGHLWPIEGDILVTNKRRPIVKFLEDTTPGIHDTLMTACDRERYENLGCEGYHRNCQDNMIEGLALIDVNCPIKIGGSLNLFTNFVLDDKKFNISVKDPVSKAGDYVLMEALIDCYMIFSTCPQDIMGCNEDNIVREAEFQLIT